MNISVEITGNILEYIDLKVKSGFYKSRSEVVREAIREMLRQDLEEDMRKKGVKFEDLSRLRDEAAGGIVARKHRNLA